MNVSKQQGNITWCSHGSVAIKIAVKEKLYTWKKSKYFLQKYLKFSKLKWNVSWCDVGSGGSIK